MSIAGTRTNNETLGTSRLDKETASSTNPIEQALTTSRKKPALCRPAVLESWINVTAGRPQPGFPNQQPQKQDEAYAAYTYPSMDELS